MGRHGPLTSLALGRSPYDEVIDGEGEPDPRAPLQVYDERGRPVNPETKRINKDIIRSHNEVMLVIGVAEPENGASDLQLESSRKHDAYEDKVARVLRYFSEVVEFTCAWGVNGLRHRVLLYKRYSEIPFYQLFRFHRTQQSVGSYLLSGLPVNIANHSFRIAAFSLPLVQRETWLQYVCFYGIMHMDLYAMMQRAGLISATAWFPSWRFFIPGTVSSPIAFPPQPTTLSTATVLQWLGGVALGVAPFAGFYLRQRIYTYIYREIWRRIFNVIPRPTNHAGADSHSALSRSGSVVQDSHRQQQQPQNMEQHNSSDAGNPGQLGTSQNGNLSVRDDEFGSDDEETEVVSATLISFDVEATEPTDTPPGWCAELRPNVAEGSVVANQEPRYRSNGLTTLPAYLATDILASSLPRLITEPLQGLVWCALARSVLARRGLPVNEIRDLGVFSWGGWKNLLGLNLLHLILQGDGWFSLYAAVKYFTLSEQE